jgi:S-adenosylmethionine uptake transporter
MTYLKFLEASMNWVGKVTSVPFSKLASKWFFRKSYFQGVFWIVLTSFISNINDILIRLVGSRLSSIEVSFFKHFFAFLMLTPIIVPRGKIAFTTSQPVLYMLRIILGFGATAFWCLGVTKVPLTVVSTVALTVPIFVLPMAALLLKENIDWPRIIATLTGFFGILIVIKSTAKNEKLLRSSNHLDNGLLFLIVAAILFALSDIFNKRMVKKESILTMLFYLAMGISFCGVIPTAMIWIKPTSTELFYLFCLGAGSNAILFCLLKAFSTRDISALAPYRYVELIFSSIFGFFLFHEIPPESVLLGSVIIIASTSTIAYYETGRQLTKG